LIEELTKMPGIGPKSAQRLALHLLRARAEDAAALADAILQVKEAIHACPICFNLTDAEVCDICADPQRDPKTVCVVSDARDLLAMERAGGYRGRYHVLQGLLSPMDGVGPDSLRIEELLQRVREQTVGSENSPASGAQRRAGVTEVILATDPTVEGDATAVYLAELLKPLGVKVTRIALGLPMGGDLDYADDVTISRSLEGRREM
jgi:recombination protein RecR